MLQSPRLRIRRPPGLTSIDGNHEVFIENAGEKRVRAHLKLGFYHPISSKQASQRANTAEERVPENKGA